MLRGSILCSEISFCNASMGEYCTFRQEFYRDKSSFGPVMGDSISVEGEYCTGLASVYCDVVK